MARVIVVVLCVLMMGCVGSNNRPLQLVSGAGPIYPPDARAAGVQGEVVVRYDVSDDGRVLNARVAQAQPAGVFDQAALAAIRSWRYHPRMREGIPEAVSNVVSTVRFRLDDDDAYDRY